LGWLGDGFLPTSHLNFYYRTSFIRAFKNGSWQKETPFFLNSDYYSVANPYLTPDGSKIYFVSDMPGGYGSTDIYYCEKNDWGWGSPVNLGPGINTAYQENFPSLDQNGNLYFSSQFTSDKISIGILNSTKYKSRVFINCR
jgi:hypothetical protein